MKMNQRETLPVCKVANGIFDESSVTEIIIWVRRYEITPNGQEIT